MGRRRVRWRSREMEEGLGMGDVGVGEVFLKRRICREGKTY